MWSKLFVGSQRSPLVIAVATRRIGQCQVSATAGIERPNLTDRPQPKHACSGSAVLNQR